MEMHMQGVGSVDAVVASELKAGDVVMFNFGITRSVTEVQEASAKFLLISFSGVDNPVRISKSKKMDKV